jgi:hypothetical protein
LPATQVNFHAGHVPPVEINGVCDLKVPAKLAP